MLVLSRAQVRELDRRAVEEYGLPGLVLMENAGRGAADVLCSLGIAGSVVICCGKGNNGGDGFVLARHLDRRGHDVHVLLCCDPAELRGDAAVNYRIIVQSRLSIETWKMNGTPDQLGAAFDGAAWVVDALLGTGSLGPPRPPLDGVINRINDQSSPVLSLDLPSGLDCDTGQPSTPTVRATHTCTFAAAKPGLIAPSAAPFVGQLHVCDIGAPRRLLEQIAAAGPTGKALENPTSTG